MQTYREFAPTGFDHAGAFLADRQDWLVAPVSHTRDSDCLTESNWASQLEALGAKGDNVEYHIFGHWACGWLEIAIVRPDSTAAEEAEILEGKLSDYPVLDESDWSEREYGAYTEAWESWGAREFVSELARKFDLDYDAQDALDDNARLIEFFEFLIPSGEYHQDGAPNVRLAIDAATFARVDAFLAGELFPPLETRQTELPL